MIRLDINETLQSDWHRVIERQLALTLMPLSCHLKHAHLRFTASEDSQDYECDIEIRVIRDGTHQFHSRHRDGLTAVRDAMSMARRAVVRSCQRKR